MTPECLWSKNATCQTQRALTQGPLTRMLGQPHLLGLRVDNRLSLLSSGHQALRLMEASQGGAWVVCQASERFSATAGRMDPHHCCSGARECQGADTWRESLRSGPQIIGRWGQEGEAGIRSGRRSTTASARGSTTRTSAGSGSVGATIGRAGRRFGRPVVERRSEGAESPKGKGREKGGEWERRTAAQERDEVEERENGLESESLSETRGGGERVGLVGGKEVRRTQEGGGGEARALGVTVLREDEVDDSIFDSISISISSVLEGNSETREEEEGQRMVVAVGGVGNQVVASNDSACEEEGEEEEGEERKKSLVPGRWQHVQAEMQKTKKQKKVERMDAERQAGSDKRARRLAASVERQQKEQKQEQEVEGILLRDFRLTADGSLGPRGVEEGAFDLEVVEEHELYQRGDWDGAETAFGDRDEDTWRGVSGKSTSVEAQMENTEERHSADEDSRISEESWESLNEISLFEDDEHDNLFSSRKKVSSSKARGEQARLSLLPATSKYWHPLHSMTASGHAPAVAMLLEDADVDIDMRTQAGMSALELAVLGGRLAVAKLLLQKGATMDRPSQEDPSLLHVAAQTGNVEMVRLLVSWGLRRRKIAGGGRAAAEVLNTPDEDGWTPLHVAATGGRVDLVRALILLGANPLAKTKDGRTALDIVRCMGRGYGLNQVVNLLKDPPVAPFPTRSQLLKQKVMKAAAKSQRSSSRPAGPRQ